MFSQKKGQSKLREQHRGSLLSNNICVGRNSEQVENSSEMGQADSYQGPEDDLPLCTFVGKSRAIILTSYLLDSPFVKEMLAATWSLLPPL